MFVEYICVTKMMNDCPEEDLMIVTPGCVSRTYDVMK